MKETYKVIFADLDGTLIETISGKTFPKGIWDMKIRFDVLDKIKALKPEIFVIITNQGGIEKKLVNEKHFCKGKMNYLCYAFNEYLGIPVEYDYCSSNDKACEYRKPNTGMIQTACFKYLPRHGVIASRDEMLMIGDASGKPGQFSDSDKKCAENFGIDYIDVNDL